METRVYVYGNSSITFQAGDSLMVNATEMAKAFGKLPADYLRSDSTKEFIGAWMNENASMGNPIITRTGPKGGTWMHEDIALDFAQWLSPKFKVWCNARIKELATIGVTAINPEDLLSPDMMIAAMNQLKAAREDAAFKTEQLALAEKTIREQAPLVTYAETVLQSPSLVSTNAIAADLGISAIKLNMILRDAKVIYKQGSMYLLYSQHRSRGIADYRVHTYIDKSGTTQSVQHLYWTEQGRRFIVDLYNNRKSA